MFVSQIFSFSQELPNLRVYASHVLNHIPFDVLNRDGVSEGQFYQVLLYELDAIRKVGVNIFYAKMQQSLV